MKKKVSYLWIAMFFSILLLPNLYEKVIPKTEQEQSTIEADNQEYRTLAQKPELHFEHNLEQSLTAITSFAKEYEAYYNDHLPGRDAIIKANSILDVTVLGGTPNEQVVMGYENWMYLKESVEWYKGTSLYTEEELQFMIENLERLDEKMKQQGGQFVLCIAPNKETIYPDYLPESIQKGKITKTEQLLDALGNTNIQIVYPKEILEEHKNWKMLYAKYDTHWNSLGGYLTAYELTKALDASIPIIEELDIYEKEFAGQDLARQLNLEYYFGTDTDYDFVGYAPYAVNITRWDNVRNWFDLPSEDKRKLLFVRDSFGTAMQYFVAVPFPETCVIHQNDFSNEILEEEAPDIFVLELVERSLDRLLDTF